LRKDGYHNIVSIIKEIPFCDEIILYPIENEIILKVLGRVKSVPVDERNFVFKAAKMLKKISNGRNLGVKIILKKNIPIGKGFGGGSGNVAYTLKGLNKLWRLNFSEKKLLKIASKISSDAPFFFYGGLSWVSGRGERIEKIKGIKFPYKYILIYLPDIEISTKSIYSKLKTKLTKLPTLNKIKKDILNYGWQKVVYNSMEDEVFKNNPELKEIKDKFFNLGAELALLTGTGSSIWASTNRKEVANKIKKEFGNRVKLFSYKI